MINITDKTKCSGCSACAAACPVNCIEMIEDEEGFVYPIVNQTLCIDCHRCEKVCKVINPIEEVTHMQKGLVIQNKNLEVLQESTAGGFYTSIAEFVIKNNGVVFGVVLDNNLMVKHVWTESLDDLWKFRNSKYVQSYVGRELLLKVEEFLKNGRLVLFSGTPCQVEGLKSFLGKEYENLITVDVVCRAVPSPLIFRKYIKYQEMMRSSTIERIVFRDKYYGYKYSTLKIEEKGKKSNYHRGVESDPWLRAFFSNYINRPSCYNCAFRKQYRVSDFTVWDCFQVGRYSKKLDNDKGVTRVLIHSNKGEKIFNQISKSFWFEEIEPKELVKTTHEMFYSTNVTDSKKREELFEDANNLDEITFFNKYFGNSVKIYIKRMVRLFFIKIGLYSIGKKIYVKVTNKY